MFQMESKLLTIFWVVIQNFAEISSSPVLAIGLSTGLSTFMSDIRYKVCIKIYCYSDILDCFS